MVQLLGLNTRLYTASRSLAINPCLSPLNPIVHNLEGIGRHSPLPCIVFIAFRSAAAQWAMVTVKLVHRFSTTSCVRIAPANASNGLTARISSTLFTTCKVISHDCGHTSKAQYDSIGARTSWIDASIMAFPAAAVDGRGSPTPPCIVV